MNYTTHSFNVGMATKLGLESAIILQHFHYWYQTNRDNPDMQKEGRVWCFSSRKNIMDIFPYISERKIRTAIDSLIEGGYLLKGEFNKDSFNKSNWYALTDKSLAIFGETSRPLVNMTNPLDNPTSVYNNNNNINTQEKSVKEKKPKIKYAEFVAMTEEEYGKLIEEHGEKITGELIKILNNYKGSKGKTYKNDYLAILNWVVDRYKENPNRPSYPQTTAVPPSSPKPKKKIWEELGVTEEYFRNVIQKEK